jgi:hypothetical protein
MNKMSKKELELISAYLDGELSPPEMKIVEEKLNSSPDFKKEFEQIKKIKELTFSVNRIPEAPFFETKLLAKLEDGTKKTRSIKKWAPAITLAIITLTIMAVLKFNPEFVKEIWEEQKTNIASLYKENLQPLLFTADLTNEDIFNFAFNNELPLDNTREQYLQLGYDPTGKEYFEIKPAGVVERKQSYNKFMEALKLDDKQRMLVDSVIGNYTEALGSQVLVNEKNTVAINPKLWNYRKALFADLLILTEDMNKDEFYKIMPAGITQDEKIRVVNAVNQLESVPNNQYIFLTPDSIFEDTYEFDTDEFRAHMEEAEEHLSEARKQMKELRIQIHYDSSWKKIKTEQVEWQNHFGIYIDSNKCRVEISPSQVQEYYIPDFDSMNHWIEDAHQNIQFYSYRIPKIEHSTEGIKMEFYDGDSVQSFEFQFEDQDMESMMLENEDVIDSINSAQWEQYKQMNDSMVKRFQFEMGESFEYFDSEELKEQMNLMQEELKQLRKKMYNWKKELREERK